MQQSSGSIPSSLRQSKLRTLSVRVNPATWRRKLFPTACICDLTLSDTTQSSWSQVWVGMSNGGLKALPSGSAPSSPQQSSTVLTDTAPIWILNAHSHWTPSLGAATLSQPGGSNPLLSHRESLPQTWRCWLSSRLFHTRLKLVWCVLKVTVWWSQQNHIICKEHRSYFEAPKGDTVLLLAAPNIIMNRDYPGGDQHLQNTFDFLQRERTQLSLQLYKWMTCSSDCSTPYSHSTLHSTARGHSYKPSTSPQNTCRLDGQTPMTMQDHGKFLLQFAVHHDEAI